MSPRAVSRSAGTHERLMRAERIEGGSNRNFGIVFAVVFGLAGSWSAWHGNQRALWWFSAAGVFLLAALIAPRILQPLNSLWTRLGLVLFRVVSPVVLALMYYLTFVPMGLLLRLSGKNLLNLRRDPKLDTYWLRKDASAGSTTMKNQF